MSNAKDRQFQMHSNDALLSTADPTAARSLMPPSQGRTWQSMISNAILMHGQTPQLSFCIT